MLLSTETTTRNTSRFEVYYQVTYMLLIAETFVLVGLSAIFSGLNIGLMSLSLNDIKRKAKLGDARAKLVLPLRKNSHLTLTSILLSNVAVISASSLVLEAHFSGVIAGVISTLLIVIFGEVFPQAYFARFALAFCAFFAPFLQVIIVITYPIAKPIQLLLDRLIAHDQNQLHSRGELGLILREQRFNDESELDENEAEIMQSVLLLSKKRVANIMTPLESVYSLPDDALIDAEVIDRIKEQNYSRIPILTKAKHECVGVLLMKDLVDIDFDERGYGLGELPLHHCVTVGSKMALDTLFRKFIAARSHMMMVTREDTIIGIVTIEDLIEEILGHEIEDESDHKRALENLA